MSLNLKMIVTKAGVKRPPAYDGERGAIYQAADPLSTELAILVTGTQVDMLGFDDSGSWAKVVAPSGAPGFCHLSSLIPAQAAHVPWLQIAQREVGVTKVQHKSKVQEYVRSIAASTGKNPEWCACFMNWCMREAVQQQIDSPKSHRWLKWGAKRTGAGLVPNDRRVGDIAIGERKSPGSKLGHIAIFLAYDPDTDQLLLLGGNQGRDPLVVGGDKSVRYTWYPRQTTPDQPYGRLLSLHYQPHIDNPAPYNESVTA